MRTAVGAVAECPLPTALAPDRGGATAVRFIVLTVDELMGAAFEVLGVFVGHVSPPPHCLKKSRDFRVANIRVPKAKANAQARSEIPIPVRAYPAPANFREPCWTGSSSE